MILGQGHHKRARPDLALAQARDAGILGETDESGIQPALDQGLRLLRGGQVKKVNRGLRMLLPEPLQQGRNGGMEQAPDVAQIQLTAADPAGLLSGMDRLFALVQQRTGLGEKHPAGFREAHPALMTFQEPDS